MTERLALTGGGQVRYTLNRPYRDGTTHVIFEPEKYDDSSDLGRIEARALPPRNSHF